jgi:hypothetical protein
LQEFSTPADAAESGITDDGLAGKAIDLLNKLWLDTLNHAAPHVL